MADFVLILGGYGTFGSRLAERLSRETDFNLLVAGRNLAKAEAFCRRYGGTPVLIDRDGDLANSLTRLAPKLIIDAAGPFQTYGADSYRVARAAIAANAHYLDLADDGEFVAGISALDAEAKARGVSAISGASSIPAISSAAVEALSTDMDRIVSIESVIVPGNRIPRGMSLVRAILAQAGQPIWIWQDGRWRTLPGWSWPRRFTLTVPGAAPISGRLASPVDAPDYKLFPDRFGAETVIFRAGVELRFLHLGLWMLGTLVRLRLVRTLLPFAKPLHTVAGWFEHWGSDRGGMVVEVAGSTHGSALRRSWTLIAETGQGPYIPPTPSFIMVKKMLGNYVPAGARPCVGEMTLSEIESALTPYAVRTHRAEQVTAPLFHAALGDTFHILPSPVRELHGITDRAIFTGRGNVERGTSPLSRLIGAVFGFPAAGRDISVTVEIQSENRGEHWIRRFGNSMFHSHLSRRSTDRIGIVWERFGPFSFAIGLNGDATGLDYPIVGARIGPIPLPGFLVPQSESRESVDEEGRFRFSVRLSLPLVGLIAHYSGWLLPAADDKTDELG